MGILKENRETDHRLDAKHLKGGGFRENTLAGAIK